MNIDRKYIVGGLLKRSIFALTLFCLVSVFAASAPKYIFLFIGDGMSIPQRMVAEEFSLKTGHGPLAMNQMPYQANTRTKSLSSIIEPIHVLRVCE